MVIKSIIIDDEADARNLLNDLLSNYPNISVEAMFEMPDPAIKHIQEYKPDVIFLDIEMPQKNGFEFLENLKSKHIKLPKIVFTTAYDHYAIQAIKASAFDYLLKPIDRTELSNTIKKLRTNNTNSDFENQLKKLLNTFRKKRLKFNTINGFTIINPEDIIYCKAEQNYTHIYLIDNQHELITNNIGKIESQLPTTCFVRISRSAIINLDYLKEVYRNKKQCEMHYNQETITLQVSRVRMKNLYHICENE